MALIGVAVVLLGSAAVKIASGSADSATSAYAPALLLLTTQVELGLGLWLLLGFWRSTAWLLTTLLFGNFLMLSLRSALAGQSDCGCFGQVQVHPWATTTLNLAVLAALWLARPKPLWSGRLPSYAVACVLAGGLGLLAWLANGPVGVRTLAQWRGQHLLLSPAVLDAGTGEVGQLKQLGVEVYNGSGETLRLLGGTVSCSCTTTGNLPCDVPAGATVVVPIELTFKGTPGEFQHRFELLTSSKRQAKLQGVIVGQVAESTP